MGAASAAGPDGSPRHSRPRAGDSGGRATGADGPSADDRLDDASSPPASANSAASRRVATSRATASARSARHATRVRAGRTCAGSNARATGDYRAAFRSLDPGEDGELSAAAGSPESSGSRQCRSSASVRRAGPRQGIDPPAQLSKRPAGARHRDESGRVSECQERAAPSRAAVRRHAQRVNAGVVIVIARA